MAPRPPLERLKARPKQDEWDDDELLSLAEAAALFFPPGAPDGCIAQDRLSARRARVRPDMRQGLHDAPRAPRDDGAEANG